MVDDARPHRSAVARRSPPRGGRPPRGPRHEPQRPSRVRRRRPTAGCRRRGRQTKPRRRVRRRVVRRCRARRPAGDHARHRPHPPCALSGRLNSPVAVEVVGGLRSTSRRAIRMTPELSPSHRVRYPPVRVTRRVWGRTDASGVSPHSHRSTVRQETTCPATCTFDVFATLDGDGSYGPDGDWGGSLGQTRSL